MDPILLLQYFFVFLLGFFVGRFSMAMQVAFFKKKVKEKKLENKSKRKKK